MDSGKGIRPTELLNSQALTKGETCDNYYRITAVSGLYTCENSKGLLVASTYDFVSDSLVSAMSTASKTSFQNTTARFVTLSRLIQIVSLGECRRTVQGLNSYERHQSKEN